MKEVERGRSCSTHDKKSNIHTVLVRKPEGKISLARFRWICEDNIKTYFTYVGYDMDWIYVAQDWDIG
jgi:hypothetical protein